MSTIRKVEFERRKPHLRRDPKTGKYVGWQIDVRYSNRRHRNTFQTKAEAEQFIDALREKRVYGKAGLRATSTAGVPRVSDLFGKRVPAITNRQEIVRAVRVFDYFGSLLDFDMPVTQIRSSHFQQFINARAADGVKPETINREINVLASAFHRAAEMYPVELEGYESPRIMRPRFKQRRRERIITEAENTAVITNLRYPRKADETEKEYENRLRIARMWHIGWLLGLRYSEIARLLKTDYTNGTLRIVRWKTGNVTLFESLPSEARELLDEAIAESQTDHVFTLSGSTPKHFYKILKQAVESAGLTWGREGIDNVTFHSLRHSFITRLVRVTDLATAASLSGHSQGSEMIAHYAHASSESRAAAMGAMYGKDEKNLAEIYEKIRSGDLDYEGLLAALK